MLINFAFLFCRETFPLCEVEFLSFFFFLPNSIICWMAWWSISFFCIIILLPSVSQYTACIISWYFKWFGSSCTTHKQTNKHKYTKNRRWKETGKNTCTCTLTQILNRNIIKHSMLRANQPFNLTNWPNHHEISFMQFKWNENIPHHRCPSCLMYLRKIYDDTIANDESHLIQSHIVMWFIKLNQQSFLFPLFFYRALVTSKHGIDFSSNFYELKRSRFDILENVVFPKKVFSWYISM